MIMAIDFGTCNTVMARWNTATKQVETLPLENLTKAYAYRPADAPEERRSLVVPSRVHYGEKGTLRAGAQVEKAGLTTHRSTFQWVKLDLLSGNNRPRRINGEMITPSQAGEDLLGEILLAASGLGGDELVVTVPVEAFDAYVEWLQSAVLRSYRGTVRMLDEATACILGYDVHVRNGQIYMVFDFGGGTLDVSVVKIEDISNAAAVKCRVLGRSGEEIGGSLIDQWLLREMQEQKSLHESDITDLGTALLNAVEDAKIRLSSGQEQVVISQFNDISARLIDHVFTVADLRRILSARQERLGNRSLYQLITRTVERALETARERYGTSKSELKGLFMAGGSSLLLGVDETLRTYFPDTPVYCHDPFEAIARGACRYAGEDINLTLVHDYCLRSWNQTSREWELVPVAPRGTAYPTEKPVSLKTIRAACEGAGKLGMVVLERSCMVRPEVIYRVDGGGLQRVQTMNRQDQAVRELNPKDREFIHADPPCSVAENRFVAGFGVDANRRLTVSLADLKPGNRSFVQLSSGEKLALPVKDLPFVKL
jgi:molecular chaperone DnaK